MVAFLSVLGIVAMILVVLGLESLLNMKHTNCEGPRERFTARSVMRVSRAGRAKD